MRTCVICEVDYPAKRFASDSLICKMCVEKLHKLFEVDYCVGSVLPQYVRYLQLLRAIQVQAEMDGEMSDFRDYWIDDPIWSCLWSMVRDGMRTRETARSELEEVFV